MAFRIIARLAVIVGGQSAFAIRAVDHEAADADAPFASDHHAMERVLAAAEQRDGADPAAAQRSGPVQRLRGEWWSDEHESNGDGCDDASHHGASRSTRVSRPGLMVSRTSERRRAFSS